MLAVVYRPTLRYTCNIVWFTVSKSGISIDTNIFNARISSFGYRYQKTQNEIQQNAQHFRIRLNHAWIGDKISGFCFVGIQPVRPLEPT